MYKTRSFLSLLALPMLLGTTLAADCFGTSVGKPRGDFLGPVDLREAMCGKIQGRFDCHGQPNEDCMQTTTDTVDNKNFLFRREWVGGGEPTYQYCEDAFNNIMEQCIDSGTAERGVWMLGQERYQILWTNNVGDFQCTGDKGKLNDEVARVGSFDATMVNRVAQAVCSCKDGVPCAREYNAGDNWLVRGSRGSSNANDDFSQCFQAMTRIMNGCILNDNYMGGTLSSGGTRAYELKVIEGNTHLVKVKPDLSDSDFEALVNKYRDAVQNTDAKRSGLDRREPQFSYTRARFFQLTGNSQVISQLSAENGVDSVKKLGTISSPTLVARQRSNDSGANIHSKRSLWQIAREVASYSVSKIARQLPGSPSDGTCIEQQDSPGHLKDLSSQGNRDSNYKYDSRAGEGTMVYVIDSGIKEDHVDFADNKPEVRVIDIDTEIGQDTQGHGTAVASLINGKTVGVAKKAKVMAIKATDGGTNNYPFANTILALDMALQHAKSNGFLHKGVINLSFGSNSSPGGIEDFLEEISNEGLMIVAGAGNNGDGRCVFNPGESVNRRELGLNVGAVKEGLNRASFSNFGDCVSLWAPGQDVRVASLTEPSQGWFFGLFGSDGFTTQSGTSFATPITSGMVAYELSRPEFKFQGAHARDFLDYFVRTGRDVKDVQGGRVINNKACSDTCEDRFGKGRCPRV